MDIENTATQEEMREMLRALAESLGTQRAAAKKLDITPQYFGVLLSGDQCITEAVARKLGFERQTIFVRTEEAQR